MSETIVGIDLGTTNSVVAHADENGQVNVLADASGHKVQPSVVSFHPNGSVVIGSEAKQRKIIDPQNTIYSAKRLIGRTYGAPEVTAARQRLPYRIKEGANQQPIIQTRAGDFAIPEISAIILDHMRQIAENALGTPVANAVITVPANFTEAQRSATATAGAIAGLTVVRVVNEPTAAALAYGHANPLNKTIAVYDFGGGTFDVSILSMHDQVYEVLGTAGDSFLGGDDLDERLVDYMVDLFLQKERVDLRDNHVSMQRLRAVAEQTKVELSRKSRAIIKVDEVAYGAGGQPLNFSLELTREEFLRRIGDIVDRTFPVCDEALKVAGLQRSAIDDVILVGGTTKMPYVRESVAKFFGKAPRVDVNPDEAVAAGAAVQAASLRSVLSKRRSVTIPGMQAVPQQPQAATPSAPVPSALAATDERTVPGGDLPLPGDSYEDEATGLRDRPSAPPPIPGQPRTPTVRVAAPGHAVDRIGGPEPEGVAFARVGRPKPPPRETKRGIAPAARLDESLGGFAGEPTGTDLPTVVRASPSEAEPALDLDLLGPSPGSPSAPVVPAAAPGAPTLIGGLALGGEDTVTTTGPVGRIGPTVLDVTPRGLGIGTVAGLCEELIRRNTRIPFEIRRTFTTSKDRQETVRIRVCQGESRRIVENLVIGDLVLNGLTPRPRGESQIEVTFQIDASGMLAVRARDTHSGIEQSASLDLQGAIPNEQVDGARQRIRDLRR